MKPISISKSRCWRRLSFLPRLIFLGIDREIVSQVFVPSQVPHENFLLRAGRITRHAVHIGFSSADGSRALNRPGTVRLVRSSARRRTFVLNCPQKAV